MCRIRWRRCRSIAVWALEQWGGEVVGVTGSAGKTSTKDVIAAMLAVQDAGGQDHREFQQSRRRAAFDPALAGEARVAVLEMGMNHAGEIRDLCAIARPRIGVVTNVGHAHMEAFDSIEGVAAAKRELIESLPPDGVAVLNADDPLVAKFREVHPRPHGHVRIDPRAPTFAPSRCELTDRRHAFHGGRRAV